MPVDVVLLPEPNNRFDRCAVAVAVENADSIVKVGYISRDHSRSYQNELLALPGHSLGTCSARITGGGAKHYGIYLHLASAAVLLDAPRPPCESALSPSTPYEIEGDSYVILTSERSYSVTGEEEHQEIVERFADSAAWPEAPLIAELGFRSILKGKYAGERAIEVRSDGERLGQLTYATSQRYVELVECVGRTGKVAFCNAWVYRDEKGLQVEVRLPRPHRR